MAAQVAAHERGGSDEIVAVWISRTKTIRHGPDGGHGEPADVARLSRQRSFAENSMVDMPAIARRSGSWGGRKLIAFLADNRERLEAC